MKLADYLKRKGLTQTEFGLLLDPPMTQMHISHIVNGRTRISLERALEIQEVTEGEVPVTSWVEDKGSRNPGETEPDRRGARRRQGQDRRKAA